MSIFGIDVDEDAIRVFPEGLGKREALTQLATALSGSAGVDDPEVLVQAVFERETVMSTGIGSGVAIPHVRIPEVRRPAVGLGICPGGIPYDTLDDQPVEIIVLFAMPSGSQKEYLGLLAQVMMVLKTPGFTDKVLRCRTAAEVVSLLKEAA